MFSCFLKRKSWQLWLGIGGNNTRETISKRSCLLLLCNWDLNFTKTPLDFSMYELATGLLTSYRAAATNGSLEKERRNQKRFISLQVFLKS